MEEWRVEAVCTAVSMLPPEARRELVEVAVSNGYAVKDIAELMAVSPPAVSRYLHGSLAPSPSALCRLLLSVEPRLREEMILHTARWLWRVLRALLEALPPSDAGDAVLEEVADQLAEIIEKRGR